MRLSESGFDLVDLASGFTDVILYGIPVNDRFHNVKTCLKPTRINKTLDNKFIPRTIMVDPIG